jgi:UDP-N-acetyl-2-amino-2-deoxyglucuronate dehydrogenase
MKFGIIGAGAIGTLHAEAIKEMATGELLGIADLRPESAQAVAEQYGVRAFASVDEMLQQPALDIVTISTPSGAHYEPAVAALQAGKHVVVEKPLEITTERIDAMINAAADRGLCLAAILNRRFTPAMDAFKTVVDNGRLGRITSASAYIKWFRTQEYYDTAGWRGTWALDGGGALMNQSIHAIDQLLYLAGPVESVQAMTACVEHANIEVEDLAVAILHFANGAMGVIEGNTCSWSEAGHPVRIQLCGTDGSVFLADERIEVWDLKNAQPEDAAITERLMKHTGGGLGANNPTAIHSEQHRLNLEEIVAAIREGRPPSTSAVQARQSVELIRAIYQSADDHGKRVRLTPSTGA